ncbi:MAG: tetratricopeptide repeat protein [Candidatus Obscuribacterales bacterium]|nr:tetratricopeptide repeat protein [Candidatus Obscuribacterales bacterium]
MINSKELIRASLVPAMTVAVVVGILLALFGIVRLATYSGPMMQERFAEAYKAPVGDRPLALYDLGLQLYKRDDHKLAKEVLTESFNQLTRNTGVVPPDRKALGSQIQFMLGVVNEKGKQFRVAITAYEDCLKLDPDNLYAKYNLERLKQQYPDLGKGGGGGSNDPNKDPSKNPSNNKKGI